MALRAFQLGVSTLEGIGGRSVVFHGKLRRLPTLNTVTGRALSAIWPLGKLTVVRIGHVAIHALLEWERLLEVTAAMTLQAVDLGVFAQQRILGLGMIEALVHRRHGNLLPATGVMARFAALHEAPAMRIGVAIGTFAKGNSDISWFVVRAGCMALLAGNLGVQSG